MWETIAATAFGVLAAIAAQYSQRRLDKRGRVDSTGAATAQKVGDLLVEMWSTIVDHMKSNQGTNEQSIALSRGLHAQRLQLLRLVSALPSRRLRRRLREISDCLLIIEEIGAETRRAELFTIDRLFEHAHELLGAYTRGGIIPAGAPIAAELQARKRIRKGSS